MFCRFCGKTVPDDSRVCMFCGKTLELDNAKKSVTQKETPIVSNVTPLAYTSDKVLVEKPNQKKIGSAKRICLDIYYYMFVVFNCNLRWNLFVLLWCFARYNQLFVSTLLLCDV